VLEGFLEILHITLVFLLPPPPPLPPSSSADFDNEGQQLSEGSAEVVMPAHVVPSPPSPFEGEYMRAVLLFHPLFTWLIDTWKWIY